MIHLYLLIASYPIPAAAQSLAVALVHAYMENPQLLAERATLRATDEQVPQALSNTRPTIQVSGQRGAGSDLVTGGNSIQDSIYSGQVPTSSYSVSLNQPLYQSGRIDAEVDHARNAIRAERAHLESIEQSVLLQSCTDYLDVVRDQAVLDADIDNQHYLQAEYDAAKARLGGGELSRVDVAQAEASLEGAIAARLSAESDAQASQANFQRDIGFYPGKLWYPSLALKFPPGPEDIMSAAETNNPDVRNALFTLRSQSDQVSATWRQALPTLALQGTYSHEDDASFKGSQSDVKSVVLQLKWAIYQGGSIESQSRQAEQTEVADRESLDLARRAAITNAGTAWRRLLANRGAIAAYKLQVSADETALTGVQKQQAAGEKTLLDVLNAQHTLLQSRVDLLRSQHDELLQQFTLADALGLLTARALRLPVKYYDPLENYRNVKDRWFGFGVEKLH